MKRERTFRTIIGSPLAPATRILLGVAGFLILALLYVWFRDSHISSGGSPKVTPGFGDLVKAFQELTSNDPRTDTVPFYADTKASLDVLMRGIAWGFTIFIVLGVLMGVFSTVNALVSPLMIALSKVPPLSLVFIFFVLFGATTDKFRVALIIVGVGPTLAMGVCNTAQAVPKNIIVKAYSLGASTPEVVVKAMLPLLIPQIIQSMRLAIGPAWVYLIASEYISADAGLGYRIALVGRSLSVGKILIYIVWLAILGTAMDYLLGIVSRLISPWAAARKDD